MNIDTMRQLFRYNSALGRLYRGRNLARGTPKFPGGPLQISVRGKVYSYSRICFAILYGYLPATVRHKDDDVQNNRGDNLYDPARGVFQAHNEVVLPHDGRYFGVCVIRSRRTGEIRGYQGSKYIDNVRHRTPVVETPEMARDLRLFLIAELEWLESKKAKPL